ncbi:uncharacterized protein DDB_G0286299-like [Prorops nasuta]|uniref:uncharacterized protein DDB_G0286299-like n=1 Tax=Prorops nasuta TaxID=863751 RepID=UPI0034CDBFEE
MSAESSKTKTIEKLMDEIKCLRKCMALHENQLELRTFGRIRDEIKFPNINNFARDEIPDPRIECQQELALFTGIACTEYGKDIVLQFPIARNIAKERCFILHITKINKTLNLQRYIMPPSFELDDILSECSIDKLKEFAKLCKNHIDCYIDRQRQYNELKEYTDNMENCNVSTNDAYTLITLEFGNIVDEESTTTYNVVLNLHYPRSGTRPAALEPHPPMFMTQFHDDTQENLLKYFKNFKIQSLKEALENLDGIKRSGIIWESLHENSDVSLIDLINDNEAGSKKNVRRKKHSEQVDSSVDTVRDDSYCNLTNNEDEEHSRSTRKEKKKQARKSRKARKALAPVKNTKENTENDKGLSKRLVADIAQDNHSKDSLELDKPKGIRAKRIHKERKKGNKILSNEQLNGNKKSDVNQNPKTTEWKEKSHTIVSRMNDIREIFNSRSRSSPRINKLNEKSEEVDNTTRRKRLKLDPLIETEDSECSTVRCSEKNADDQEQRAEESEKDNLKVTEELNNDNLVNEVIPHSPSSLKSAEPINPTNLNTSMVKSGTLINKNMVLENFDAEIRISEPLIWKNCVVNSTPSKDKNSAEPSTDEAIANTDNVQETTSPVDEASSEMLNASQDSDDEEESIKDQEALLKEIQSVKETAISKQQETVVKKNKGSQLLKKKK